jgi:hypothetical protein
MAVRQVRYGVPVAPPGVLKRVKALLCPVLRLLGLPWRTMGSAFATESQAMMLTQFAELMLTEFMELVVTQFTE